MFPNSNPFPLSPPPDHILFLHHQYNHRDLLLQPPPAPSNVDIETNFHPRRIIPNNTKKADRHSKIYTAQGPRDRRVRLSIGIARKFFDLQDTLGFDKASQTLDWLLHNSKSAIKDLVQSKFGCSSNVNTSLSSIYMSDNDDEVNLSVIKELEKISCKEKKSRSKLSAADLAVKESRARARARARERTRVRNEMKKSGPFISHQSNGIGRWSMSNIPVVLNWEIGTTANLPRFVNPSTDNWDFGKPWDVYNNQII